MSATSKSIMMVTKGGWQKTVSRKYDFMIVMVYCRARKYTRIEKDASKEHPSRFGSGETNSHATLDSKDERSIANKLAAAGQVSSIPLLHLPFPAFYSVLPAVILTVYPDYPVICEP